MVRIMKQWLQTFFFMLTVLRIESQLMVNITYVQWAVEIGAVCLDGSPPAYYMDRGFGTGVDSWLVHIQGGGWCESVETCLSSTKNWLGSTLYSGPSNFSAILGNDSQLNPDFYNWNRVKVRYCDGSSFTGDVEAVDPVTKLHYRGGRVFRAIVVDLLEKGMKNAENAILTGCSAGGLTSMLHCDSFKDLFPTCTNVKCFADAGYFINEVDVSGERHIEKMYDDIVTLHGSAKNLPSKCTSKMRPSLCFFPQNMAQYIETPLFILNSPYDSWQIPNILVPGGSDTKGVWQNCTKDLSKCTGCELQTLQEYRLHFLEALTRLGPSKSRGYYINSCHIHCQTELQKSWFGTDSPMLNNKTIAKAVADWFYDRSSFQEIDCPYPCDKTCCNEGSGP